VFNWAIFRKTVGDWAGYVLVSAAGTMAFVILFVVAMVNMGEEVLEFISQFAFLRRVFEMSLGIRVDGDVSLNILFAVSFTHLVTLTLAWGVIVAAVTRTTVGEIDQGTADLLFSLPVSRWEVCFSTSAVWVVSAALLAVCPLLGVAIGGQVYATQEEIRWTRFVPVVVNLFALHLSVGGLAALIGGLTRRRGFAVAMIVGFLLASVALNFVEPFIPGLQPVRPFGLLHYFRPVDVVRTGEFPWTSLGALCGLSAITWLAGTMAFCRRDIPAP
jgi:ABC-type transport system involved in multi-copper enzyme maturation permease subunit